MGSEKIQTSMVWMFSPSRLYGSSFERSEVEGRAELGIGYQNKLNKKKRHDDDHQFLYLVKPSFNLQKLFLMFSTSTIYPKCILRKQFLQKNFSEKKKIKKNYSFFFFRFFSFVQNLLNTFFFLFYCNLASSNKKKDRKNASLDQYNLIYKQLLVSWPASLAYTFLRH